jgi:predicted  nucleic acid-binding Zn-ribbon protein
MYKTCINCGTKYDLSEKMCPKRKCPECGGKLKMQYTQEELKEIQKQNDDMVPINTFLL